MNTPAYEPFPKIPPLARTAAGASDFLALSAKKSTALTIEI